MRSQAHTRSFLVLNLTLLALLTGFSGSPAWQPEALRSSAPEAAPASPFLQAPIEDPIFIPVVISGASAADRPPVSGAALRVNAPYFSADVPFPETAIFWFGRVSNNENYADVRIAYTSQELYVHLSAFDRFIWYDEEPSPGELSEWDAASLYLSLDGNQGSVTGAKAYRFDGQFSWWEKRAGYQAAYQGNGSGWSAAGIPFKTEAGWRGSDPNTNENGSERGWSLTYHIPFASLGLSAPPAEGKVWGMAVALHDRDDGGSPPLPDKTWPERVSLSQPSSWGQLSFGLPVDRPPQAASAGTTTIRHELDGARVEDAAVGGTIGNMCPGDNNFIFNEWGNQNFGGAEKINIQNQRDVADFPCFSKYYVTFPLDSIPSGKVITSAALTMHLYGGAGGGEWGPAPRTLVQVMTAAGDWDESTLTWNNAPLAGENIARAWVEPFVGEIKWPGAAYSWDVRRALAEAYDAGEPLRLVLYGADEDMHTGKYFSASEESDQGDPPDWNAKARPTLTVTWGSP